MLCRNPRILVPILRKAWLLVQMGRVATRMRYASCRRFSVTKIPSVPSTSLRLDPPARSQPSPAASRLARLPLPPERPSLRFLAFPLAPRAVPRSCGPERSRHTRSTPRPRNRMLTRAAFDRSPHSTVPPLRPFRRPSGRALLSRWAPDSQGLARAAGVRGSRRGRRAPERLGRRRGSPCHRNRGRAPISRRGVSSRKVSREGRQRSSISRHTP